jgi:hypothetical protein
MTKAIKLTLEQAVPTMPIGISGVPRRDETDVEGSKIAVAAPYFILYPLWTTELSGPPFSAPDADADWTYQISGVAKNGLQLEWMRDKVFEVMLSRDGRGGFRYPLVVDGMSVMDRYLKDDSVDQDAHAFDLRFGVKATPTL